jgi:hypothetical protein
MNILVVQMCLIQDYSVSLFWWLWLFEWGKINKSFCFMASWKHDLKSLRTGKTQSQVSDNILSCQKLGGKGIRFPPLKKKRGVDRPEKLGYSQMRTRISN